MEVTMRDTRQKLEEDARAVIVGGYVSVDEMRGWLDRQAAITRAELQGCPGYDADRHYCKYHANDFDLTREQVCDLRCEVSRLERQRDELQAANDELQKRMLSIEDEVISLESERDELQAKLDEYDETHIELPLDMNGVPIRAGDLVEVVGMEDGKAVTIACDERGRWSVAVKPHHWDTPTVYSADELRHAKSRTIEDVLDEFVARWMDTHHDDLPALKAKYADELRKMGGA